ncbi:MAG: protein kinase [Candidatus Acidiferrales bacterium]
MTLKPSTRLGPYEILAPIGAGGMGEVYRAHDSKLGRDVAMKVLPDVFARDAERMARFQREAKVLASLNHPNIASIYGLEDSGQTHALVMELVEGPTLRDRISTGAIPIGEVLRIAKQMCEALEYAHEHGIVHRDLKPANVKVTTDDAVKLLDFGLAKAYQGDASSIDIADSPTISRMATQAGVLLGTAAYMSPEQAKAKPVDRRADIWAFGCVLYEMLTGKMTFHGDTVTDTLASVIKEEPDWSQLPAATPMRVRVLLQRCLQKDPKQRLQAIGDARISLDEVLSGAPDAALAGKPQAAAPRWRRALPWAIAGGACLLAALIFVLVRPKPRTPAAPVRFQIAAPANTGLAPFAALSPDSRKLAFLAASPSGNSALWVHFLDTGESRMLTDATGPPFWSPDSRFIGYELQGKLMKIEATGGPPQTLADIPGEGNGYGAGTWSKNDVIVFGNPAGLFRVPASGGVPTQITAVVAANHEDYHYSPTFLPDGRHILYTRDTRDANANGIYLASVDAKPEQQSNKLLVATSWGPGYARTADPNTGYLLFMREGTLMAQPFDNSRLELKGQPTPIAEQVGSSGGGGGIGSFSASANALAYIGSSNASIRRGGSRGNFIGHLAWFDREGKVLGTIGDLGVYRTLALSPDGKSVAFERADVQNPQKRSIWLYDFARGVTTRFTFNSDWDMSPVWSPDGSRIAYGSLRDGDVSIYLKASNLAGEGELLYKSNANAIPSSWSPDGRFLLFYSPTPPVRIWILPLSGAAGDRKPIPFEDTQFDEAWGRFSPDGRWIAYHSDESGRNEIYVRPFDAAAITGASPPRALPITGKWMVSKDGGTTALWRRDGKELFYLSLDGKVMAVDVSTSGVFQAGIPKELFKAPDGMLFWNVAADGKRFIMASPTAETPAPSPAFSVILNWETALKK